MGQTHKSFRWTALLLGVAAAPECMHRDGFTRGIDAQQFQEKNNFKLIHLLSLVFHYKRHAVYSQ
jgi:hypothetical protein